MRRYSAVFVVIGFWVGGTLPAAEIQAFNLLRHPQISLEPIPGSPPDMRALASALDGKAHSSFTIAIKPKTTLRLLFAFGGEQVTLEKLRLVTGDSSSAAIACDLLVSTLAPTAGYQSVRRDSLKSGTSMQEFSFGPIGAKWVMLRLTPRAQAEQISIAEIQLVGHTGPPATRYKFKEAPAKAFDVLRRLEKIHNLSLAVSRDEASLFDDAKDGQLDTWSFEEAALLSCGIRGKTKRQWYLDRLDHLEKGARKAVAKATTPFEKGRALLQFLHKGPMRTGYVAENTDVTTVLEDGKFNCVSSATLYAILGRRLGLDIRGIEVPNHAFAIIYNGTKHADVETTTAQGFDPARDALALAHISKVIGFAYIPDKDRDQRREVNEIGLIAINCCNHGVYAAQKKQYEQALMAYFRAMSLDPESGSAVKGVLSALSSWSKDLIDGKQFPEALEVLAVGLDLAPDDALLRNNRLAAWVHWADKLADAGRHDEALGVLRLAAKAIPDGNFAERQAWVVIRRGEALIKAGQYSQALALVPPGLAKMDEGARSELRTWCLGVHRRWAYTYITAQDWSSAAQVYQYALSIFPNDSSLRHDLEYCQSRLRTSQG